MTKEEFQKAKRAFGRAIVAIESVDLDDPAFRGVQRQAVRDLKNVSERLTFDLPERLCDLCLNSFRPQRPWGRFCSEDCRKRAHKFNRKVRQ